MITKNATGGEKMRKGLFDENEVIAFIENKIKNMINDENELDFYLDYVWNGFLNKRKYYNTYKKLIREMKYEYYGV